MLRHGTHIILTADYGSTALLTAVCRGHAETVELLIKLGADALRADANGNTPLALAEGLGHATVTGLLTAMAT